MNIICSDQAVGWIGASLTGPRGPANRATRLRVTSASLGHKPRAGCLRCTRARAPKNQGDAATTAWDKAGQARDDLRGSRDFADAIALTDGRAVMVDEVLAAGQGQLTAEHGARSGLREVCARSIGEGADDFLGRYRMPTPAAPEAPERS